MKSEQTKITVTAKSKILKFNEGQDLSEDEPFEVVEKKPVYLKGLKRNSF